MNDSAEQPRPALLREFLLSLPKAELHLHLEGTVQPETLLELNRSLSADDVRMRYHYSGFAGFLKAYVWVTQQLDSPDAYRLATRHMIQRLKAQNVRYAEVTLSAGVILWKNQSLPQVFEAIADECQAQSDVEIRWIFDAIRQFGPEQAARVFAIAREYQQAGVVAIGIGGDEERGPAIWFADLYRQARTSGLGLTCHAGEVSGPESVWQALRIGAQRIGHGIRSIDDPQLLDHLRENEIPLEVCPTSNVCTGAISHLMAHPIRKLHEAGVPIVLGTDDPALFFTDLLHEYTIAVEIFGFSWAEAAELAANSLKYRFPHSSAAV